MDVRVFADNIRIKQMDTQELRHVFLVEKLFQSGMVNLVYSDTERAIVGGAIPINKPLVLKGSKELASESFNERRETGIINLGGDGKIQINEDTYLLDRLDCLYVGRGVKTIRLYSENPQKPAEFYVLSYPAHKAYSVKKISQKEVNRIDLGSDESCNKRTIFQYIRPGLCPSCQLVMGLTTLAPGSNWNTMPPHTHARRTEIYLYFDLKENNRVFHFMGEPHETRHLVIKNKEVVLSPSWSIHAGVGTSNYSFVWGMGGENQDFDDMDFIEIQTIK
ncbi:MAG: 5-dehydro-4-deoxy-D-glucuronate isomerase [Candidatus Marinimicrobia bacterium]|nr:5-dehydro-4-deoxy-D-glucuronate isomerase [Candidatus Neomarinimicrobiota bacterium]